MRLFLAVIFAVTGLAGWGYSFVLERNFEFGSVGTTVQSTSVSRLDDELAAYQLYDLEARIISLRDHPRRIYNVDGVSSLNLMLGVDQSNIQAEATHFAGTNEPVFVRYAKIRNFPSAGYILLSMENGSRSWFSWSNLPEILRQVGQFLIFVALVFIAVPYIRRVTAKS